MFAEDIKQPSQAGMMCTTDRDTFFHSQGIHGLETGASFHIINDDSGLFNIINVNESIQLCIYASNKNDNVCVNIQQVDGTEWIHTLWPMKFCPKKSANLFSLICKPLKGRTISSNNQNNSYG